MITDVRAIIGSTALSAGSRLKKHAGNNVTATYKGHNAATAVTEYDISSENYIKEQLALHDRSIGFHGEETGHSGSERTYWLVDPIDGTGHFVRGTPFCSTMISLIDNGEVVATAVYLFMTDQLFTAVRGQGTLCNGTPVRVSTRSLSDSYLTHSTDLVSPRSRETFLRLQTHAQCKHFAAAGYEMALIASGLYDGNICFDPHGEDWDYAPALLIAEAGGIVTTIGKDTWDFRNHNFIAANPLVHAQLNKPDSPLQLYM